MRAEPLPQALVREVPDEAALEARHVRVAERGPVVREVAARVAHRVRVLAEDERPLPLQHAHIPVQERGALVDARVHGTQEIRRRLAPGDPRPVVAARRLDPRGRPRGVAAAALRRRQRRRVGLVGGPGRRLVVHQARRLRGSEPRREVVVRAPVARLVAQAEAEDAGVAPVPQHHALDPPKIRLAPPGAVRELARVRRPAVRLDVRLVDDEEPAAVAGRVEGRRLRVVAQAHAVEVARLEQRRVVFRVVPAHVRAAADRARLVAVDAGDGQPRAVEPQHAVGADGHVAPRDVAGLGLEDRLRVVEELDGQNVDVGPLGAPDLERPVAAQGYGMGARRRLDGVVVLVAAPRVRRRVDERRLPLRDDGTAAVVRGARRLEGQLARGPQRHAEPARHGAPDGGDVDGDGDGAVARELPGDVEDGHRRRIQRVDVPDEAAELPGVLVLEVAPLGPAHDDADDLEPVVAAAERLAERLRDVDLAGQPRVLPQRAPGAAREHKGRVVRGAEVEHAAARPVEDTGRGRGARDDRSRVDARRVPPRHRRRRRHGDGVLDVRVDRRVVAQRLPGARHVDGVAGGAAALDELQRFHRRVEELEAPGPVEVLREGPRVAGRGDPARGGVGRRRALRRAPRAERARALHVRVLPRRRPHAARRGERRRRRAPRRRVARRRRVAQPERAEREAP